MKKKIVIGLGGIGSKIVDETSQLYDNEDIIYLGIDTDIDSYINSRNIFAIRISDDQSIKEYLKKIPNWQDWLLDESQFLFGSLIDGTRQNRVFSRIAFEGSEYLQEEIYKIIEKLILDSHFENNLEVIIVSTLAGGTGSGIVVQLPLLLKKLIANFNKSAKKNINLIINGIFIMPDIFENYIIDPVYYSSIYSNTYATLKEIEAINTVYKISNPKDLSFKMKLENFDSCDNNVISNKLNLLYQNITLLNNKNLQGNLITTFEELIGKVSFILREQLLESYDFNINRINSPIYGSADFSKLVYPFEDILDYIALRKTSEILGDQYKLIKSFEYTIPLSLLKKNIDLSTEEIIIEFVEKELESPQIKFNFLQKDLLDSNLNIINSFYENLKDYINDSLEKNSLFNSYQKEKVLPKDVIEEFYKHDRDKGLKALTLLENNLENCQTELNKFTKGCFILELIEEMFSTSPGEFNNINFVYLLKDLHPISTLYALSKLICLLEKDIQKYENKIVELNNEIHFYEEAYDDPDTEYCIETVFNMYNKFTRKLFFFHRKSYKEFIEDYIKKATQQFENLKKVTRYNILWNVLRRALVNVEKLLNMYFKFFKSLEDLEKEILKRVEILSRENSDNSINNFIKGSPDVKNKLYHKLSDNLDLINFVDSEISSEIFKTIYSALLKEDHFMSIILFDKLKRSFAKRLNSNIKKIIKEKMNSTLDYNIGELLLRDPNSLIDLNDRNSLLITLKTDDIQYIEKNYSIYKQIGIHPDTANNLRKNKIESLDDYFSSLLNEKVKVIESKEYSPYEISIFNKIESLSLNEISLIQKYYENYKNYLSRLGLSDNLYKVSPHLDYHWDTELPEIIKED